MDKNMTNEREQQQDGGAAGRKKLFTQAALARISSPDQLNDYIRVANPSVWLVLAAVLILLAALLIWSVYGMLPTTIAETCVAKDGVLTCYMSNASDVAPGMSVRVGNKMSGTVAFVSDTPYSSREVGNQYSDDYIVYMLGVEDWNFEIRIDAPGVPDGLTAVTIITGEVHPISFILN